MRLNRLFDAPQNTHSCIPVNPGRIRVALTHFFALRSAVFVANAKSLRHFDRRTLRRAVRDHLVVFAKFALSRRTNRTILHVEITRNRPLFADVSKLSDHNVIFTNKLQAADTCAHKLAIASASGGGGRQISDMRLIPRVHPLDFGVSVCETPKTTVHRYSRIDGTDDHNLVKKPI